DSSYVLAFVTAFFGSMAAFMVIPYISPFLQLNMGFPRQNIEMIYFIGGIGSFFAMHITGKIIDKTSSTLTSIISNLFILFTLILGFILAIPTIPVIVVFASFMIGMSIRNVSNYTLFSKVPHLNDRAGFMSVISCVQHLSASAGAIATSLIVAEYNNRLEYMNIAAIIALLLFLLGTISLSKVERKVRVKE
ncbi:MAG: MFS transporter, partial [Pseudomonadota bacterium]